MNQVKFKNYKKAAFLDRDGVINEDTGYLKNIKDFKWVEGAIEALKILKKNNFLIIIISNATEHPDTEISKTRRKPSPRMIEEAIEKYNLNRDDCFMIGDKDIDVLAAKNAKIRGFLFEGGNLSYKIKKILNIT